MKRKLRKNPKKTILFYSAQAINKKSEKITDLDDKKIKLMRSILEKIKSYQKSFYKLN